MYLVVALRAYFLSISYFTCLHYIAFFLMEHEVQLIMDFCIPGLEGRLSRFLSAKIKPSIPILILKCNYLANYMATISPILLLVFPSSGFWLLRKWVKTVVFTAKFNFLVDCVFPFSVFSLGNHACGGWKGLPVQIYSSPWTNQSLLSWQNHWWKLGAQAVFLTWRIWILEEVLLKLIFFLPLSCQ